jgi:hypothetical protein
VAGQEGTEDHVTLGKAIQSRIKCAAYHIDYAGQPSNQKSNYSRKLRNYLRERAGDLPDNGVVLVVTAKAGFVAGVHGSDYLNIPNAVTCFSSTVIVPDSLGRLYLTFNVTKARLHKPGVRGRVLKTELLQAAEKGVLTDFDFQQ